MKRCSTRWRPDAALGALAAGAWWIGCVGSGTHQTVVRERDALAARVQRLERTEASLDSERARLFSEIEDMRLEREKLDADLVQLRSREAALAADLARREEDLAQQRAEVERLRGTYDGLVKELESEVAAGAIQIQQLRDGIHLNVSEDVLFASGSADVNASGRSVLARVADHVQGTDHRVVIAGHTDDQPISRGCFPSNWELAARRATEVVRLIVQSGVAAERLEAVSYGEFDPIADNATPEGRSRNRRIEITLKPTISAPAPAATEPATPPEKAADAPAEIAAPNAAEAPAAAVSPASPPQTAPAP